MRQNEFYRKQNFKTWKITLLWIQQKQGSCRTNHCSVCSLDSFKEIKWVNSLNLPCWWSIAGLFASSLPTVRQDICFSILCNYNLIFWNHLWKSALCLALWVLIKTCEDQVNICHWSPLTVTMPGGGIWPMYLDHIT